MKLAGLAVLQAPVIIHAVCDVGILLCLQDLDAALDRVDGSRIDLYEIPLLHGNLAQKFVPSAVVDHILELALVLCVVADHERRPIRRVKDIPALGLSKRTVLILSGIRVIRVHLNAQIIIRIDDLDQERKAVARRIAKKLRLLRPELAQSLSGVSALPDRAVPVGMRAHCPALPGIFSRNLISPLAAKLVPAPDHLFEYGIHQ